MSKDKLVPAIPVCLLNEATHWWIFQLAGLGKLANFHNWKPRKRMKKFFWKAALLAFTNELAPVQTFCQLKDQFPQCHNHARKPNQDTGLALAGWLMRDLVCPSVLPVVVQVSGEQGKTNECHAKLQGFHAMPLGLLVVCGHCNIQHGSVILGVDDQKGTNSCGNPFLDPPSNTKHAKLIQATQRIIHDLPITIHVEHAHGHHDTKGNDPLNPMECRDTG